MFEAVVMFEAIVRFEAVIMLEAVIFEAIRKETSLHEAAMVEAAWIQKTPFRYIVGGRCHVRGRSERGCQERLQETLVTFVAIQ